MHTSLQVGLTRYRKWLAFTALFLLLALLAGVSVLATHWPFRYRTMEPLLERVFASNIHIDSYRRIYLPHPGLIAKGITLRRNTAPDLPPIGSAQELRIEGNWLDLLLLRRRVRLVDVDGLHLVIPPPGTRAHDEDFPRGSSADFGGPTTPVLNLEIHDATLDLMRRDGGRYSFPIHSLTVHDLEKGKTVTYALDMDNALPVGRIQATGTFGPLISKHLADTQLTGDFLFAPVNLESVHGLHGTGSAKGRFYGRLSEVIADAKGEITAFAVGRGRPTPVRVEVHSRVNGLNGDILFESVKAVTGSTTVTGVGRITGSPKVTNFDLEVIHGRVEDVLRPFNHGSVPLTGPLDLTANAVVSPSGNGRKFLDRLSMAGNLHLPAERMTNARIEQKLSDFSARVRVHGPGEDTSSKQEVLSAISGPATLRHGVAHASALLFAFPGASARLHGDFNLRNQEVAMFGDLAMDSDISHVTTGFKSLLLKPLAPFFRRKQKAAVLPIAITGKPGHYKIGQNLSLLH